MGRRTFSKEYKLQTTRQVIEEGKCTAEVSSSLGITEQTIYRWLREYDKYGEEAFKGFGPLVGFLRRIVSDGDRFPNNPAQGL